MSNIGTPVDTNRSGGPMPPDFGAALIRTVVPYVTAFIVAKLAENGIAADTAEVNAAVVTIGGSLWYMLVRILEQRWPKAGWLLGSPKTPIYSKPE